MKVCISGSLRFEENIKKVGEALAANGVECLLPTMGLAQETITPQIVSNLVFEHFEKINAADIVLVVNPGGYFGNSVKTEIGYAKGAGKKVIFLAATGQPELDCLADQIIPENDLGNIGTILAQNNQEI